MVIDDNRAIHGDFRKILCGGHTQKEALEAAEALLFEGPPESAKRRIYEIDSAYQGKEGLALVQKSLEEGRPYAVAFVDIRMPPGWDGIETAAKIWEVCPDLQIVICTAYSDYSWDEMEAKLGNSDRLLILKKPFDAVEVLQLARALTEKWGLQQQARLRLDQLEKIVQERTRVLQETNSRLQVEIAERARAAEALRESEERYQLLFRKNPLPMWVIDLESLRFLAVNETAVREYGYSTEEFLSFTIKEIRPPEEGPAPPHQLANVSETAANSFLTRHKKKDGSVIDVEIIAQAIAFDGRQAKLVLANNVTERKLAEDRIREQALLLNLAHDAIFVRDLQGRIEFWNKGAERLYGWSDTEAVHKRVSEVFSWGDPMPFQAAEKTVVEKGEWSGELRMHTKTGQEIVVDSRWTLLRDGAGNPRSVLVINTDISEKKKLEAQFLRSQRLEGIGTLATGMAHDLNNILAPILMSAGALRWKLKPGEQELAITRIEMSVKRAADIIQQVLTFGRGVSGERMAIDPRELMEEAAKIMSQTFPKNITITLDGEAGLWPIIGDKTQIHQVLLNLGINSRDAMPKGGEIIMRAEKVTVDEHYASGHTPIRPGPYVMVQVTDTGCGIPPKDIERIFDPFFTTKELGKGTGLGLSTVLGIVKSHRGLVTVESELNRGTTFRVLLPASPETVKREVSGNTSIIMRGKGEVILLVDDEADILSVTRKLLERVGYKVLEANDGHEALSVISQSDRIDLVLTDIMMPQMDGVALIQELREKRPRIKIIASSGLGSNLGGNLRKGELAALGVKAFLTKPYAPGKLLAALREILDEKRGDKQPVCGSNAGGSS